MQNFLNFIQNHAPILITYKYLFLFLGGLVEGMNTLVLAGFLASAGQVHLYLVLPMLIVAHTLNGYLWYLVGYWGGGKSLDRWGHQNKLSHKVIWTIENYFKKYSARAIMFAKFTFSLEIATLILSGSLKYDLKKFSKYNFLGSFGWVIMATLVGFFFGESFKIFFSFIRNLTIFIFFLAGAIVVLYLLKLLFKRYFVRYMLIQARILEWKEKIKEGLDDFLSNGDN